MGVATGVPKVNIREIDLTTKVPSFPGVYGGIIIPGAKKGPVSDPYLCASETQFLQVFTPDERIEVGYDLAYYSAIAFLAKSNKLWVIRAAINSLYGGVAILESGGGSAIPVTAGIEDPEAYAFGGNECLLITGASQGDWANDLYVEVLDNDEKEPGSFRINVIKNGVEVERFVCSRTAGTKDGYGRNIYVEDVTRASRYISVVDNIAIDPEVLPEFTTTPVQMASGDDGDPVTDNEMILNLDKFSNKNNAPMTLLMDGGRATEGYQLALIQLCEARKDCITILSVPFEAEDSADYVNEIIDYRDNQLNASSSYAAMYSPHVLIEDKFNDRQIYVSPDGYVGGIISETAANYEIWYPPAGARRGTLLVLDVRRRFLEGEMDLLFDKGINPIRFRPGQGIAVWGDKTLLGRPSNLDQLSTRLLLIVLEPAIAEALEDFEFELNDVASRALVESMINSYMEGIKARRGVYGFMTVCNEDNNTPEDIGNDRMNVDLFVKPIRGIRYIEFTTIITRTSMDFKLAQQSI